MKDVPAHCPHCGEPVSESARFCRHCGSSEADGWGDSDDSILEEEFDYDEFVENEFSQKRVTTRLHPVWKLAAVLVIIAFLLTLLQF